MRRAFDLTRAAVVGCAIALVANYLFWARDNATEGRAPLRSVF